jgi:uncharacterized protein YdhG (YjbR/CyaY superfamily)
MAKTVSKGKKKSGVAEDVDSYIAIHPEKVRVTLERLRKAIRAAAPKAEESISYQIPAFKYQGPLVFFAAFKSHCSLFVASKSILKTFADELEPYKTSGTTIHFSADHPLPAALVRKIVKARIRENEARTNARSPASKPTRSAIGSSPPARQSTTRN